MKTAPHHSHPLSDMVLSQKRLRNAFIFSRKQKYRNPHHIYLVILQTVYCIFLARLFALSFLFSILLLNPFPMRVFSLNSSFCFFYFLFILFSIDLKLKKIYNGLARFGIIIIVHIFSINDRGSV